MGANQSSSGSATDLNDSALVNDDKSKMESEPLLDADIAASPPPSAMSPLRQQGTIKKLFTQKDFVLWFIFKITFFTAVFSVGLFVPLYAAEWFGGCLESDDVTPIDGCSPDYTTYTFWSTMFYSIGGVITFSVSSYVGHLTDKYGRKLFFYVAVITWMIPRVVMIFYINFYVYFSLCLLTALNGGDFFIASKAYLTDLIPDKSERMVGFGFGESAVGAGCILGAIIAVSIASVFNDHAVFVALSVLYVFMLIYIYFFIKEPERFVDANGNRVNTASQLRGVSNPFRYLGRVFDHKVVGYLSLLSFMMGLVETGIMCMLFSYIGNEFSLSSQGSSAMVYAIYAVLLALAVILAGFLIALFKRKYDDIRIMVIAISIKIAALLLLSFISLIPVLFKNYIVLYVSAALYGSSFTMWPALVGILTKYIAEDQQGTGFGILDAWTGMSSIIAPFGFGYLYVFLVDFNLQWMLFMIAIGVCVVEILIALFPLRNAIAEQEESGVLTGFGSDEEEVVGNANMEYAALPGQHEEAVAI